MTNTNRTARIALRVTLASGRTYYVDKAGRLTADMYRAHGFGAADDVKAMFRAELAARAAEGDAFAAFALAA